MSDHVYGDGPVRPYSYTEVSSSPDGTSPRPLDQLAHIELTLAAVALGGSVTMHDVASWHAGKIVELDRAPTDPVDLRLNGRLVGRGHIVVDEDELSVRVGQLLDAKPGGNP